MQRNRAHILKQLRPSVSLWFISRSFRNFSLRSQFGEFPDQTLKELRREKSVVDSAFASPDRAQIKTGPRKHVYLVEDDPRAVAVETQVFLDPKWDLHGDIGILRR